MRTNIDTARAALLQRVKRLFELTNVRKELIHYDLCEPSESDERMKALRKLAEVNKDISATCQQMREIEKKADGQIGVSRIFSKEPPEEIRVAASLLVAQSLTSDCHVVSVGHVCSYAGGTDPIKLLCIRQAFASDGIMRAHVHSEPARTVNEQGSPTLTESSFCNFLNLPQDDVQNAIAQLPQERRRGR